MAQPLTFKRRLDRKVPRLVKAGRHWMWAISAGARPSTRLVFVVGSQRSGTRLPLQAMDLAPEISTYSEGTEPFFRGVMLAPLDRIDALIRRSPSPIVALKPICETHRIIELLDRFSDARGIWIFRNYADAVNSASVKWKSGREALRRLVAGDPSAGWRAGGITPEKRQLATRLYRPDMSLHEANAVMWYLRNRLYFDLGASARQDVLLVRYEDLVTEPEREFARMFDHIGTPLPPACAAAVKRSSAGRQVFPEISPKVRRLCDELHDALLDHYRATRDAHAAVVGRSHR
jgi:Sulfotransferase domain